MKFHKNKFLTTVSAIALVLAVGACSSSNNDEMAPMMNGDGDAMNGDGDGDATNGGDDTKTPAETLADARDALTALPADATDEAEEMAQELVDEALRLPGNEAELIASLDAEVEQAEERQSVLDLTEQERQANAVQLQNAEDALANASAEDKEAAQAAVDEALQMPGNEAALIASLEQQVDDAAQAKKVADAAEAAKEASAMARGILAALGDGMDTAPDPITAAASSAGKLTVKATDYTMSESAPDEITGWRGAILTKDGAEVHVYTNIDDSKATAIGEIYGIGTNKDPGEPVHYDVVNEVAEGRHDIPWAVVKRADDKSTTTGDGTDAKTTFAGNVRGVAGTFSCGAADCTVPSGDTLTGTNWTFVPTDPDGKIDVADSGYLTFGWWLNQMDEDEQVYQFDAFASAAGMGDPVNDRAVSGVDGVDGSATYKGAAAGKYAMQSTIDSSASGGHFTANATLTANFDANTADEGAPANENGVSIGGKIDGFMTGDVSRPNWKVTLTAPEATENIGPITNAATKWATGGAVPGVGTWNADFYGAVTGTTDTGHPTAVVGEFNAAIGGGDIARISGAFGATKQ